jgi:hypothetical protein
VRVVLRSDPIEIGTLAVSANGTVEANIAIPSDLPTGSHTLEFNGTDSATATAKIESTPISVLLDTGGTVRFSGTVTTSDGRPIPYAFVSVWKVDNQSNSAIFQTGADGRFGLNVPKGLNRISIYWLHYSDTQSYGRVLGIPMEWYYTIDKYDILQDFEWNLVLPEAITFQIKTDSNWTGAGQNVSVHPVNTWYGSTDGISSTFSIAPGAIGNFSAGTQDGIWISPSESATVTYFPLRRAQIDVGGCIGCTGLSNVNIEAGTVVSVPSSGFTTLDTNGNTPTGTLNLSGLVGNFANEQYNTLSITAVDGSWFAQKYISTSTISIKVPEGVPLYARYTVVGDDGNRPNSWAAYIPQFTVTGSLNWALTLPTVATIQASSNLTPPGGGTAINPSLTFSAKVKLDHRIQTSLGGGQSAFFTNSFYPGVFNLDGDQSDPVFSTGPRQPSNYTASKSGITGSFYLFTDGFGVETATVTASIQSSLNGSQTPRSISTLLDASSTTSPVTMTFVNNPGSSTSTTFIGAISNSLGGVGITRVTSSQSGTYPMDWTDSLSDGTFSLTTSSIADNIFVIGSSNISNDKGVPTYWWLKIPRPVGNIGTFTLPDTVNVRFQVVGPYGLPIPNALVIEDAALEVSDSITLTSSLGVVGYLYNGACSAALGCVSPSSFGWSAPSITDAAGFATLKRFLTTMTGQIRVIIPAGGPNASLSVTYDPINLVSGSTRLTVASRK